MIATTTHAPQSLTKPELTITRTFDAPRRLVFEAWTRPEHMDHWMTPQNFTIIETRGELRPGGAWRMAMRDPKGEIYAARGVYREITPDEGISFTHQWEEDDGTPEHETLVTVRFEDAPGGGTLMTFHQAFFRSVESRDSHRGGWSECFDKLADYVARLV